MLRRNLLKTLLQVLVGMAVTRPAQARTRRMLLQTSPVAGFQYHEGDAVWPLLSTGASLALVREPQNAYDERVVRVDWNGHQLDYVPRLDNAAVAQLFDRGETLEARIAALRESRDPWQRIGIEVGLKF